ncbi:hypothetical protein FBU31_000302 [Coemansia sp. 'formosensis']|nr:hypothetical protein FBU31_000302 [Coemansia sp. 'formosensis']
MSPDISRELWQHSHSQQSTIAQCRRTSSELYLTWVETLADASSISTYCSAGTPGDSVDVPDWLDSRAKGRQLFTGMSLLQMAHRIRMPASEKGQMSKQADVHVAERATRLLQLLEQVAAKRKHAAACIRDLQAELGRQRFAAKQHGRVRGLAPPAPATNELVKTQVIQMWVSGPIVLTIRPRSSYTWAIDRVLRDVSLLHAAHVTSDSIIQLILNSSIHATSGCLSQLTQICNQATYELSQPAVSSIHEAVHWIPMLARCRKISLHLLRHSQANQSALRDILTSKHTPVSTRVCGQPMSLDQIVQYDSEHRSVVYGILEVQQRSIYLDYRRVERRLSIINSSLLARQQQRLLLSEVSILRAINWGLGMELIVTPIEFWHHADNMNLLTPGRLLRNNPTLFYWYLLAFGIWGLLATYLLVYKFQLLKRA